MISGTIEFRIAIKVLADDELALADHVHNRKEQFLRAARAVHKTTEGVKVLKADVITATPFLFHKHD